MSCPSALIGHLFVETQDFASLPGSPLETRGNDN